LAEDNHLCGSPTDVRTVRTVSRNLSCIRRKQLQRS
jgi:hypothetical protein